MFLEEDVRILELGWLEELVQWAALPEVGIAGAKILGPKWEIQHAGIILGLDGPAGPIFKSAHEYLFGPYGSPESYRNYHGVSGSCITIRREVFDRLGGFDEQYRVAYGDVALCLQTIKAGLRVIYTPYARLLYKEYKERKRYIPDTDRILQNKLFSEIFKLGDPFFNPNLSYQNYVPAVVETDSISLQEYSEQTAQSSHKNE